MGSLTPSASRGARFQRAWIDQIQSPNLPDISILARWKRAPRLFQRSPPETAEPPTAGLPPKWRPPVRPVNRRLPEHYSTSTSPSRVSTLSRASTIIPGTPYLILDRAEAFR